MWDKLYARKVRYYCAAGLFCLVYLGSWEVLQRCHHVSFGWPPCEAAYIIYTVNVKFTEGVGAFATQCVAKATSTSTKQVDTVIAIDH